MKLHHIAFVPLALAFVAITADCEPSYPHDDIPDLDAGVGGETDAPSSSGDGICDNLSNSTICVKNNVYGECLNAQCDVSCETADECLPIDAQCVEGACIDGTCFAAMASDGYACSMTGLPGHCTNGSCILDVW